jgi:hypothetical protein
MPAFRLQAKHLFLTYPHAEIAHFDLYEAINNRFPVKRAIIASENHADGSPHMHAYFEFNSKLHCRDERAFDIDDKHPNIQAVRNVPATITYCKKDGRFTEFNMHSNSESNPSSNRRGDSGELVRELAARSTHADYLEECIRRNVPYAYAIAIWRSINKPTELLNDDVDPDATMCGELLLLNLDWSAMKKSLVIVGKTGTGKTTWSKMHAPKPALFVRHLDRLKDFEPGRHKSIIFDDMDFKVLPRQTQLFLTDLYDPAEIHIRYGTVLIPKDTIRIFTVNEYPFIEDEAIARRVQRFNLH